MRKTFISLLITLSAVSLFAGGTLPGWTEIHSFNAKAPGERIPGFCYTVFSDRDCSIPLQTVWGNNLGVAAFKKMAPGTYFVRNMLASAGFMPDGEIHEFDIVSGRCTVLEYFYEPSNQEESSGPNMGKFKYTINGTISGVAINDMMSNGRVLFTAEHSKGNITPEFKLVNKYTFSILTAKDVSIKCLFNSQTLQYKIGTEVGKTFMKMYTYEDETASWREVPYITENTTYNFSGKMAFAKIPDYMMNCRLRFTYGDKEDTIISGQPIELSLVGSNLTASYPYEFEKRNGVVKVKVNVLTGKSKFSITENNAIGVKVIYAD